MTNIEDELKERCREYLTEDEKTMNLDQLLIQACSYGSIEYIEKYLDMGANVNGNIDFKILETKPTNDIYAYNPLYSSISDDSLDCAKYLVSRGADINFPQGLINQIASYEGELFFDKVDAKIIDENANIEMQGTNFLLYNGARINDLDVYGRTIIESVINNVTAVWDLAVDFLIEKGADINLLNSKGETPLDSLKNKEYYPRKVEYLISKGAKTSKDLKKENKYI